MTIFYDTTRVREPNRFEMVAADPDFCFNPLLPLEAQSQLQIYDALIDCFGDFVVTKLDGNNQFQCLRVSETRALALCDPATNPAPLTKHPVHGSKGVFLPCTLVAGHWSLIVVNLKDAQVHLLDSLYLADKDMIQNVRDIVTGLEHYYEVDGVLNSELVIWDARFQKHGTVDCGAFVSYYMHQICMGEQLDSKVDIVKFRKFMRQAAMRHVNK